MSHGPQRGVSWREVPPKDNAVMQTVGLALPELYHLRAQDVATPVFGLRHLLFPIELLQFLIFLSQILPIRDHRTLVADHSTNLAALGAGVEVALSLLLWQLLHRTLHSHLLRDDPGWVVFNAAGPSHQHRT